MVKETLFVNGMKSAGKAAAIVLEKLCEAAKAGVTTNQLNELAEDLAKSMGYVNAPLGYKGFPKSICTSLNSVMCHGIPDDIALQDGDLINIDVTLRHPIDGYHGDTSRTIIVGGEDTELLIASRAARDAGIAILKPNVTTNHIGFQTNMLMAWQFPNYKICKDIGGHGIGKKFHDAPYVPSWSGSMVGGWPLKPWTCITVEPIICEGSGQYTFEKLENSDIVIFKCAENKLNCQFEHTVLITDTGHEIMTVP